MQKNTLVFHPLILAIFPSLALYLQNATKLKLNDILPTIGVLLISQLIIWAVIHKIIKNLNKSGLILSVFSLLFFSFGHIFPALINLTNRFFQINLAKQIDNNIRFYSMILLIVWIILFLIICWLTLKSQSNFLMITQFMNITSLVIAGIMIFQALQGYLFYRNLVQEHINFQATQPELILTQDSPTHNPVRYPDIYYIILDGYARADILNTYYQYDNSIFLSDLTDNGFYIADHSHSNYPMTLLSLASSLNIMYLETILGEIGTKSTNPAPMIALIQQNGILKYLNDLGYTDIAFATGFSPTELREVDMFMSPPISLNGFQNELINLTPFRIPMIDFQYDLHRERIEYIFSQIPRIAHEKQSTITFAHIVAPHPPFVFDSRGNAVNPRREFSINDGSHFTDVAGRDEYVTAYTDQLIYISNRVVKMINDILTLSEQPPIIIVQGDHGPGSMLDYESMENSNVMERLAILNAYYFPDQNYKQLYPSITPVNTFRVILSQYLDTSLELLEDRIYFSTMVLPYAFTDVTDVLNQSLSELPAYP